MHKHTEKTDQEETKERYHKRLNSEEILDYIDTHYSINLVSIFELTPELQTTFSLTEEKARFHLTSWLMSFADRRVNKQI